MSSATLSDVDDVDVCGPVHRMVAGSDRPASGMQHGLALKTVAFVPTNPL
jgi:hypothetical protein